MRRVSRRLWAMGAVSGLCTSCLSPTLPPLPPPNQPETRYVSEGLLLVEGRIPVPEARVVLLNIDTSRLAGQLIAAHRYDFLVSAQPGHRLELWYEVGRERSDPIQFVAPPRGSRDAGQQGDAQQQGDASTRLDAGADGEATPGARDAAP